MFAVTPFYQGDFYLSNQRFCPSFLVTIGFTTRVLAPEVCQRGFYTSNS